MKSIMEMALEERKRHKEVEGWTEAHDDNHDSAQLACAAACYCLPEEVRINLSLGDGYSFTGILWPWDEEWWKPSPNNRIREIVKSISLLLAEGERLQRLQNGTQGNSPVDATTRLYGSNQEQLQSDSQVQQGDDREGNGIGDAGKQASSNGERTASDHIWEPNRQGGEYM